MSTVIQLQSASKTYSVDTRDITVLQPTDLTVERGEFIAVTGPSGSGKSTLLNLITGIDHPTGGMVIVDGQNFGGLSESKLAHLRGKLVGIVFQFFQLIPTLTSLENIVLAMDLVGSVPGGQRRTRAMTLLEQVGVGEQANKLPSRLSGGEQQRVAIARALANDPSVLIADEPTGNLDSVNAEKVRAIFAQCAADGRTVIVATHDPRGLEQFDRVITISDGVTTETPRTVASASVAAQ
jgi:putative ABC transport system ATP-binding protein